MGQRSTLPIMVGDYGAGAAIDVQYGMIRANRTALPCCDLLKDRIPQDIREVLGGVGSALLRNFEGDELAGRGSGGRSPIKADGFARRWIVEEQRRRPHEHRKSDHQDATAPERDNGPRVG